MTTMDSDSESQDSDEGRRFRFEATRKDSVVGLHSRKRRSSPARTERRRRSRSVDRSNRDRRNVERGRHDYSKQSRGSLDTRRPSRDGDAKHSKDTSDSARGGSRYKDGKDSKDNKDNKESRDSKDSKDSKDNKDNKDNKNNKDSKDSKDSKNPSNSSSNHKGSRLSRESSLKSSRKDSRTRERDRRRSNERSSDRCFDDKQQDKYASKSSVRGKRHSRDRSRERSHQTSKPKTVADLGRPRDEPSKTESARKIARRDSTAKSVKDARRNAEPTNVHSESDANSRASSPSARTDCRDLNLSDFDIVSDIDESSPENSRQCAKESSRRRGENSLPAESESGIKRRVSKQQYERLLKRQAVKNRRSLEELHKVKAENGEHAPGTSNNNRRALSDSPLGALLAPTTAAAPAASLTDDASARGRETRKSRGNDKDEIQSDSDNSRSNSSTYGPILPPKVGASGSRREDKSHDTSRAKEKETPREKEKIAPRIIGPTIPAHFRQCVDGGEIDAEDTFGPALPPHLELNKPADKDSDDENPGSPVAAGNVSKSEESAAADRAASEADDDDFMGPLPSDHPALENDAVQRQLELRARRLKAELAVCDNEDEKKREEWMIELPAPQTVSLGLAPRKFRVRPAPDMTDRSSWTDTPADKARKRMEKIENRNVASEPTISHKREANDVCSETEKSRKRQKSLVEIHQKKLQKKKKKEEKEAKKMGKTAERRPFDRDVDLQANRFDEARKKSMFMKSRELDDRFSRGKI